MAAKLEEATTAGTRTAIGAVAAAFPSWSLAWGRLAEKAESDVEAYAYARVGYHRGLDALRAAGWRGTGYVRWAEPPNRGFLLCVELLRQRAEAIGETAEVERCAIFLKQLDPQWSGLPTD
jgi:hypothetical protein